MNDEQRALIESIIKQNPAYRGNEALMEQFCAEVYKKSYLLLDSVSNIDSLKNYLTKVVDTSISNVVKNSDIISVADDNYFPSPAKNIENNLGNELLCIRPQKENKQEKYERKIVSINRENDGLYFKNPYDGLIDPLELIPEKPTNPMLSISIVEAVKKLDAKEPAKKFKDIFVMRYVQNLHQSVIARNLKLSQADLSKRFCEMVKLVREEIL